MANARYARLGVGRLGVFRLGAHQPWIKILINGVDRTSLTRIAGASITDELNHEPNTVRLVCSGFTPVAGYEVKIYQGDTDLAHQLFGGHILSLGVSYEGVPANVIYTCSCIDYTWLLNRVPVIQKFSSQTATAISQSLISTYTAGFTSVHVTSGLATLDEITFTNEDLTTAITRVVDRIGGYWYVEYDKDVKAFLTSTETAGSVTDTVARTMSDIKQDVDLSQVATRVTARGGGSNTAAPIAVGQTTLPLESAADTWYASGGGIVECGPQRIAYTGKASVSETGSKVAPFLTDPGSGLTASQQAGSTFPNNGTWYWAFSFVNAAGEETGLGVSPSGLYTNNSGGTVDYILSSIDVGPSGTTQRKVYRTKTGGAGGFFLLTTLADNSTTSYVDQIADASLGSASAPTTNNTSTPVGSTSLPVVDTAQFLSAGGWAEAPGGQIFRYTGRSVSSGPGTLTGIPASGIGSLTATVGTGTARTIPHLTGVTGVLYAINKGEPVNLIVTVNDATAQTAMAGFVGGDGIHEMFMSDGRWSITEATARATAELTLRKDPLVTVTFQTRDQTVVSGRDLTITLTNPPISGTFKIQRVTYSEIGIGGLNNLIFPLRQVECSSRRFSFEDVLRQIKARAA